MAQKLSSAGDDAKEEAPFGISQEAQASMKKAFLEVSNILRENSFLT